MTFLNFLARSCGVAPEWRQAPPLPPGHSSDHAPLRPPRLRDVRPTRRRGGALTSDASGTFPKAGSAQRGGRGGARSAHAPQRQRSPRIERGPSLSALEVPLLLALFRRHVDHHRAGVRGTGCSVSLAAVILGESRARAAAGSSEDTSSRLPAPVPPPPLPVRAEVASAGRVRGAPARKALTPFLARL